MSGYENVIKNILPPSSV